MNNDDDLIGYREAAQMLGVTPGCLRALVHRLAVPHIRLARRLVRFRRGELQEWLRARSVSPSASPPASSRPDQRGA
jgi:excisionase family DNA binding protein